MRLATRLAGVVIVVWLGFVVVRCVASGDERTFAPTPVGEELSLYEAITAQEQYQVEYQWFGAHGDDGTVVLRVDRGTMRWDLWIGDPREVGEFVVMTREGPEFPIWGPARECLWFISRFASDRDSAEMQCGDGGGGTILSGLALALGETDFRTTESRDIAGRVAICHRARFFAEVCLEERTGKLLAFYGENRFASDADRIEARHVRETADPGGFPESIPLDHARRRVPVAELNLPTTASEGER